MRNETAPAVPQAYLFLMTALLFGFPLLTAYYGGAAYGANLSFYFDMLIPYLVVSAVLTMAILLRPVLRGGSSIDPIQSTAPSTFMGRFNSLPVYLTMAFFSATVVVFGIMRYLVYSAYPYPAPPVASDLGSVYIVLLIVTSIFGFTRLIYRGFPALRGIFQQRGYAAMAAVLSVSFATVYLILVNQILIAGFNVPANLPPPSSTYPFEYTFTAGVEQPLLNMVYLPYAIVQLTPQINLLIIPFEMVFAVLLSLLVASNVTLSYYLISRSGLKCSTTSTTMSSFGSVLGLTATCPTCLVPTIVSVLFGGVAAATAAYSNVYGATLPTVISISTLLVSLVYLTRTIRKRGLDPQGELGMSSSSA